MQTRQITREAIGIVAVGASFFLLASLFSFNVGDDVTRVFPVNETTSNLGGMTGFNAARELFSAFGVFGGYAAGVLICLFSFAFLTRKDPSKNLVQGVLGSLTLVLTASVIERLLIGTSLPFFGHITEDLGGRLAGGYWGIFIETWVSRSFSNLALLAMVAAGLGTGLAMAMEYFQDLWAEIEIETPTTNPEPGYAYATAGVDGVMPGAGVSQTQPANNPINESLRSKIVVAPTNNDPVSFAPAQKSEEETVDIPLDTVTLTPNSERYGSVSFELDAEDQQIDNEAKPETASEPSETWLDKAQSLFGSIFKNLEPSQGATQDDGEETITENYSFEDRDSGSSKLDKDRSASSENPVASVLASVFQAKLDDPLAGMPTASQDSDDSDIIDTTISGRSDTASGSTKVKRDALEAFFDDSQALKAIFTPATQGEDDQDQEPKSEAQGESDSVAAIKETNQETQDIDVVGYEEKHDQAEHSPQSKEPVADEQNIADSGVDNVETTKETEQEVAENVDSAKWDLSAIASKPPRRRESARRKVSEQVSEEAEVAHSGFEENEPMSDQDDSEVVRRGEADKLVIARSKPYQTPSMDLLEMPEEVDDSSLRAEIEAKASLIEECLKEFRIEAKVEHIERGPNVTLYALALGKGIKVQRISALLDNLALVLAAPGAIRLQAPIRGTSWVGLEVPNEKQELVSFAEIYRQPGWRDEQLHLPIFLGKDTAGRPLVADLAKLPHLLVAGATGSGKSVCINTMILSLLMTRSPEEVKLILIDPKQVELAPFSEIPHLLSPVVTDMRHAGAALDWAVQKMEERYNFLARARVRHLREYNKLGKAGLVKRMGLESEADLVKEGIPWKLPYIVVVVDELNDLMMVAQKEVEASIMRLAQKSRAIGIHVILATQRPSVDVITGVIKSNLPARLAFQVTSKVDSRTILDVMGAEKLLGMGDMLFLAPGRSQPIRAKGAYVSENELERVLTTICDQREPEFAQDLVALKDQPEKDSGKSKKKRGRSRNRDENGMDELFEDAVEVVLSSGRGSVSLIQRKLGVGYARAARMIEAMSDRGILGGERGSKARKVLMSLAQWQSSQD